MATTEERIRRARFHTKPGGRKFKITQKEADGFGVTGFVGRVTFEDRWTRRGRRPIRPIRTEAYPTLEQAISATEALASRDWSDPVATTDVHEIDSLGREIER